MNKQVEELTLLLLYLTAWEEEARPFGVHKRSWKHFSPKVLEQLDAAGFLVESEKSDSVFLTREGADKARLLARKYLGEKVVQLL